MDTSSRGTSSIARRGDAFGQDVREEQIRGKMPKAARLTRIVSGTRGAANQSEEWTEARSPALTMGVLGQTEAGLARARNPQATWPGRRPARQPTLDGPASCR
jgi:hypothetical protein